MIIIGLTGNFASGKSETANLFKRKGAKVLNADEIARKITRKGTPLHKAILKIFGKEFLAKNGEIDRRKLAWHVFSKPRELKRLNVLVHPGIIIEAYKVLEKTRGKKGVLVLDVPLLFEAKMEKLADFTVVVKADESTMISRASRKGVPAALTRKILASQWSMMKKAKLADFVIDNNGTPEELKERANVVYARILEMAKRREKEFGANLKNIK